MKGNYYGPLLAIDHPYLIPFFYAEYILSGMKLSTIFSSSHPKNGIDPLAT